MSLGVRSSNNGIPPTLHCTFPENSMDPVGFDKQRPGQQTTDDVREKEDYGALDSRGLREEKNEKGIVQQDTEEKQERELATGGSHDVRRAVLQEHHADQDARHDADGIPRENQNSGHTVHVQVLGVDLLASGVVRTGPAVIRALEAAEPVRGIRVLVAAATLALPTAVGEFLFHGFVFSLGARRAACGVKKAK